MLNRTLALTSALDASTVDANTPQRVPQGACVGDADGGRPNLSQRKPSASAHPVHVKRIGKARKRDSMQNLSTTAQRSLFDPTK